MKPRSLRPAVSPEQIEKLRRADDRPTKYHSDVAVLVVDFTVEEDNVQREHEEKIETFFQDLNSRNEVAIIYSSQETRKAVREMKEINYRLMTNRKTEDSLRENLDRILHQRTSYEKQLEKEMEMQMEKVPVKKRQRRSELEQQLTQLTQQELRHRGEMEKIIAETKKRAVRDTKKLEELKKEITKPITTALNGWIRNQGWLTSYTFIHVFCNKIQKGSFNKTPLKKNKNYNYFLSFYRQMLF